MTNNTYTGYIGTYTKGNSKGVYSFTLDTEAAILSDLKEVAQLENPTYLNISKNNQYLYAVNKEGEGGGVSSFSIDPDSGELTLINSQLLPGSSPCHVSMDSSGEFLFSANYHKGTVESYLIDSVDGSILSPSSVVQHEGHGPDPRQEKPHVHYAGVTPDENFLAVVDLGIDALITYGIANDGKLTEKSRLNVPAGSGPRHLTFHPNQKLAYIMTEFSSEVIVLEYNKLDGSFFSIQTISTLPDDFIENNQGSAIHISGDGLFVYAGNRGHNSIAVFGVNQDTGKLHFVEHVSTAGDWPRDFALDPSEKFIVASNQNSSNLVLYARDKETGKLTLLQSDVEIPDPVCVKFLHY
jgi:6-phosphogluconolactonase